jgi:hypothetical protein
MNDATLDFLLLQLSLTITLIIVKRTTLRCNPLLLLSASQQASTPPPPSLGKDGHFLPHVCLHVSPHSVDIAASVIAEEPRKGRKARDFSWWQQNVLFSLFPKEVIKHATLSPASVT